MTIDAAAGRFYTEVAQHQASGEDVFRWLSRLVDRLGPNTLLSEIADAKLAEIVARRRGDRARNKTTLVAPATVNRDTVELLRRIVHRAADTWGIDVGKQPRWHRHRLEEPEERVREASWDEEDRLFAQLRPDLHPIVRFAILSGCRLGECRGLTWPDVDFERLEIQVVGKSRKPGGKLRIVPMTRAMVALLQGCRGQHADHVFTYVCDRPRTSADGLVVRRKGERYPISRDGWRRLWSAALAAAKVKNFRMHDTRHTSATRGLRASGNLKAVQKQLGHADIKTTAKYAHVLVDDIREMMEAAARPPAESRNSPEPGSGEAENTIRKSAG
ncbi:tyrosine-type recombinase/integrase [Inquilinus sp. CA228]|uniref:tyrosine-type recombinase/integrase n=1 Tax=Inquilinus sp. CA228 TaxID=3455609 RepID=UPI003F8CF7EF